MTVTPAELKAANCWFTTDAVARNPDMTAFKREARWRQHLWASTVRGITEFGHHRGRSPEPGQPASQIPNGTKLTPADAQAGVNFLSPDVARAVERRLAHPQPHETLDAQRLRGDLLSSMPMAFNLFGEASMPQNGASRSALAHLVGADQQSESAIEFEWSPGRTDARYTRDRTAFDVALLLGSDTSPRTVVGIETKYHEHPTRESQPSAGSSRWARHGEQTDFLVAIAESSGAFKPGWQDLVLGTELRQVWRDHVLALSMRQHPELWTSRSRFVLAHPARNVGFATVVEAYRGLLVEGEDSFAAFTIEALVNAAFAHGSPTREQFTQRYFW